MSTTTVIVKNQTDCCFALTQVVFNEVRVPSDQFWRPSLEEADISPQSRVVIGKLRQERGIPKGCNFIVSLLLHLQLFPGCTASKDSFFSLKLRLKGSKTGCKLYSMAHSFPVWTCVNPPRWTKGTQKDFFVCTLFDSTFRVEHEITWNEDVVFRIFALTEPPVFARFLKCSSEGRANEERYEIQERLGMFRSAAYKIKDHFRNESRNSWTLSTIDGKQVMPEGQIMPPTSLWTWLGNWAVDTTISDDADGWVYVNDWWDGSLRPPHSTKIRYRRWIRPRSLLGTSLKAPVEESERFCSGLEDDHKAPFLALLLREVAKDAGRYDLSTIAGIPSPWLRRQVRNLDKLDKSVV